MFFQGWNCNAVYTQYSNVVICYIFRGEYFADLSENDSDPIKYVGSDRVPGVNRKGLRVPILTFTKGYSNWKIFRSLSVLFARPEPPDP